MRALLFRERSDPATEYELPTFATAPNYSWQASSGIESHRPPIALPVSDPNARQSTTLGAEYEPLIIPAEGTASPDGDGVAVAAPELVFFRGLVVLTPSQYGAMAHIHLCPQPMQRGQI